MVIYGVLTSPIVLGAKQDLCATCNVVGPHVILRRVRWVEIFFVPVLPLWMSHRLVCANCGAETKLGFGQVRRALRVGKLPLPHREKFKAYADGLWNAGERLPAESEFDPIEKNPRRDAWNVLLKAWPVVVVLAVAGLAFLPGIVGSPAATTSPNAGHDCWVAADGSIAGCRMHDGSVVGDSIGTPTRCYFIEPLPTSEYTLTCRD